MCGCSMVVYGCWSVLVVKYFDRNRNSGIRNG